MSWFSERMTEAGWPVLVEQLGESATYSPENAAVGAPPVVLMAIIKRSTIDATYDRDGRGETPVADFEVSTEDIPNPQRGDIVTFDDKSWVVTSFDSSNGAGYTRLRLKIFEQEIISGGLSPIVRD